VRLRVIRAQLLRRLKLAQRIGQFARLRVDSGQQLVSVEIIPLLQRSFKQIDSSRRVLIAGFDARQVIQRIEVLRVER
jgi:hypothetical protein